MSLTGYNLYFPGCVNTTHPVLPPIPEDSGAAPVQTAAHPKRTDQHPSRDGRSEETQNDFLNNDVIKPQHVLKKMSDLCWENWDSFTTLTEIMHHFVHTVPLVTVHNL